MTNAFPYARGSEWRKWDLHVHTPASHSHAEYGSRDWGLRFVNALNAADVEAVAITDYFVLDGYSVVLSESAALKKVVFPGVELRLEDSVHVGRNVTGSTTSATPVNLQLIFDNDTRILGRIQEYLHALRFKDYSGQTRSLTRENLIELGRQVIQGATDDAALKVGCERALVPKDMVEEELTKRHLRSRALMVLPYDLYGGIDEIDPENDSLIKSHLTKMADIIETGNEHQRDFFLGKAAKLPYRLPDGSLNDRFLKYIGHPKPCVRGSDSKAVDDIGRLPTGRHCWLKADPTFDGLKQILYEPEERVNIQTPNPRKFDRSRVMVSMSITGSSGWFDESHEIRLNEGLVGVIGGKGTGKTALLDLIGLATGSYEAKPESFLESAKDLLKGCTVTVRWDDGNTQPATVGGRIAASATTRYLSQGFVREKCDPRNAGQLQSQIESVIYQNLPGEDSSSFSDFESLRSARLGVISDEKSRVRDELRTANESLAAATHVAGTLGQLEASIVETEKAIAKLDSEREAVVHSAGEEDATKKLLLELKQLGESRSAEVRKVSGLQASITKTDRVLADIRNFHSDSGKFVARLRESLEELEVDRAVISALEVRLLPANLAATIDERKKAIQAAVDDGRRKAQRLDEQIAEANAKLGADKAVRARLEDVDRRLAASKNQYRSQIEEKKKAASAKESLPSLRDRRRQLFGDYFDLLRQEKAALQSIYAPIESGLREDAGEANLFSFSVQFIVNAKRMAEDGNGLVDHAVKGRLYQGTATLLHDFIKSRLPALTLDGQKLSEADRAGILGFVDAVEEYFRTGKDDTPCHIASQMRSGKEEDFYAWLYSPEYYSVGYSIRFKGTELESLSPGLKGAALLILYLELDQKDRRPILIDQPEENLDNRTVYETLRSYFRTAKSRRQVIVVTHNPNLVVNTDAEQTVVANFCREGGKQPATICYVSGALENTFTDSDAPSPLDRKGIREHICEILEGGQEAFEKREEKYGFA